MRSRDALVVVVFLGAGSACEVNDVVARPFGFRLEERSAAWCASACGELRACDGAVLGEDCEADCAAALAELASFGDACAALTEALMLCYDALGCDALARSEKGCAVDAELWTRCDATRVVDEGWLRRDARTVVCRDGDGESAGVDENTSSEEPWIYCEVTGWECTDQREHRLTCTQDGGARFCTCFVDGVEGSVIPAPSDGGCGKLARIDFGCGWILP